MNHNDYTLIASYCDPWFSQKGDSKAIVLIGYRPPGFYDILRVYCGNATINEMITWHYDLENYCNKQHIAVRHYMEDVFYQKANLDMIIKIMQKKTTCPCCRLSATSGKKPEKKTTDISHDSPVREWASVV